MNQIKTMLQDDIKQALGCTEPIAIAYACAKAHDHSKGELKHLRLLLSGNIIKNVMGVGIPGTPFIGAKYAALLGYFYGDSSLELRVLSNVKPEHREVVEELMRRDLITMEVYDGPEKLFVGVTAEADNLVNVVLQQEHTNITDIIVDGEILEHKEPVLLSDQDSLPFHLKDILDYAWEAPLEELRFILKGVEVNRTLSEEGSAGEWGLQIGRQIEEEIKSGLLKEDLINSMTRGVCAAIDARMDGAQAPAYTNSGSGNQGLITHLSPYFAATYLKSTEEQLIRAEILSNAIPIYMKNRLGKLGALCGVTSASSGVAAALVYLLGGNKEQVVLAVKNVLAGISGMICDGAKPGCSLKVASGMANAVHAAGSALKDHAVKGYEGIVDQDIEASILHYVRLGLEGMEITDKVILDTMIRKA